MLAAATYRRLYEGLNYRLRTFGGGRWASHCRPTSVVFLVTELCNARCLHCDIWKNRGKEDTPTVDRLKTTLAELRKWLGAVQVTFSGGEALLKPYTVDLVAYGSSLGFFMEVLTHGYWGDQSKIEELALAKPGRVTISLDGIGETHSKVRGREGFFDKTATTIETLRRMRGEHGLDFSIRLKTVIMQHNYAEVHEIARFAAERQLEVFYQPIEQNYNTPEDRFWFQHNDNWPKDTAAAVRAATNLIQLKRDGLPIANSYEQLETMTRYFENPDQLRVSIQSHMAHERRRSCAALTMLQIQANGDVTVCTGLKPVGNIKDASIRQIWERRPHVWEGGCCLEWRCSTTEKEAMATTAHL